MTAIALSSSFALQSSHEPLVVEQIAHDRGLVCLIAGVHYPLEGEVTIRALRPLRHYRLCGAAQGFCRTDADGTAAIAVTLSRPSLLILAAVVA